MFRGVPGGWAGRASQDRKKEAGACAVELDQLRNFLCVAEKGSFTRAAEEVALSQPALSRSIQRLEEELGQPLFDRQTRKVVLTDAGNLLLMRARQIVSLAEDAKEEICDDGQTGHVRVGAIPTIAPYFLPQVLQEFKSKFPKANVIVHEDTTHDLIRKVNDGIVDIAIAALPIEAKYLQVQILFDEELLLVLSKHHSLVAKSSVQAKDLEGLPFILLGEAHCLTTNVVSFCQQKLFSPVSVEQTSQIAMIQELVTLDHGVSLIPQMARVLDKSPDRVYRSLAGKRPHRTIVLITNPYRFQSKLQKSFASLIDASTKVTPEGKDIHL